MSYVDDDGLRIRCAHVANGAEFVDVGEFPVDDPPVGVDDVGGTERRAVVPAHSRAEVKGPGELVGGGDLPGFRERRSHLEVLVGLDEGVEHVLQHLEGEVRGAALGGVELVWLAGDRRGDVARRRSAQINPRTRRTRRQQPDHYEGSGQHRWSSHDGCEFPEPLMGKRRRCDNRPGGVGGNRNRITPGHLDFLADVRAGLPGRDPPPETRQEKLRVRDKRPRPQRGARYSH